MSAPLRRTRRRLPALALAWLIAGAWTVALSPIAAAHHRATHAHVTCEHGEQIEVDAAASPATAPAPEGSIDRDAGSRRGTADPHHHCSLGCAAAATVAARPIAAIVAAVTPAPAAAAPDRVLPALDVLHAAPKTSPPV